MLSELVAEIVDIFCTAAEADADCSRVNGSAPPGEHRRLRTVELTERGLDNFSMTDPSIIKTVLLPDYTNSAKMAWPVHQPLDWSSIAPVPSHPARWASENADRKQAIRAEHERTMEYYASMARKREKRENVEAARQRRHEGSPCVGLFNWRAASAARERASSSRP